MGQWRLRSFKICSRQAGELGEPMAQFWPNVDRLDPRRVTTGKTSVLAKAARQEFPLAASVPCRSSGHWMRPTHIGEGHLLY